MLPSLSQTSTQKRLNNVLLPFIVFAQELKKRLKTAAEECGNIDYYKVDKCLSSTDVVQELDDLVGSDTSSEKLSSSGDEEISGIHTVYFRIINNDES